MTATLAFDELALADTQPALGMLSLFEQRYLEGYAKKAFLGNGCIVDLGCFTGSSTVPLARGLSANPHVKEKSGLIHAYDQFIWEEWMYDSNAIAELHAKFKPGDSFFSEFIARTAPFADIVVAHAGDLLKGRWSGTPIELLFNDVSKSWALLRHVIREFYGSLIPGGVLMEQDFVHSYTFWLHVAAYEFREYFEPVGIVPRTATFVFRLKNGLPKAVLENPLPRSEFDRAYLDRVFDYTTAIVPEDARTTVLAAKAVGLARSGIRDDARELLAQIEADGIPNYYAYNLSHVRALLA